MKIEQSLKKLSLIIGLSMVLPIQSLWASTLDPISYAWVGQCDPLAVDIYGNPEPGSCTGDAQAKIIFDSYQISSSDGSSILTPLSVSSFTYYDNDPLFAQAFGDKPVTWFFDSTNYTFDGNLLLDGTGGTTSDFSLSFATTNNANESMLVSFASYADGMWSFTAKNTSLNDAPVVAGQGGTEQTNQVPEPATIALFMLGLLCLMGFGAKRRNYQLALN